MNKIELIEDPSLISKQLTISNVSIHVNYGKYFKSFEEMVGKKPKETDTIKD